MKKTESGFYVADNREEGMTAGELLEILKEVDPNTVVVGYDSFNTRAWLIDSVFMDDDKVNLDVFETD